MANARRCDRCGAYYGIKVDTSYIRMVSAFPLVEHEKVDYDLCDDCMDDFDEFMRGIKPKNLLERIKAKFRKE